MEGVISENHLSNLSHLTSLDLRHNSLTLELSSKWVPPFQLDYLNVASCKLGPLFPKWILTQNNFSYLDMTNTEIFDSIPITFWDRLLPSRLSFLNLSSNHITGTLPNLSLKFDKSRYAYIDLSSNQFEGPIPLLPSSSGHINLSRNKFSGELSFLHHITDGNLRFLDLSHNLLTGEFPDCLLHFQKLYVLNLAHNKLSGKIPASVGSLSLLETLYLYNNSFSGELPLTLRNCTSLAFFDLGANKFSGKFPAWIGENLLQLYALSVRSNRFSGTVPLHLCNLTNLHILDLSMNNFSGNIPSCVNNLTPMVQSGRLDELTKPFPTHTRIYSGPAGTHASDYIIDYVNYVIVQWQGREIEFESNLKFVVSIDLSSNKLTGEIPDEIFDLVGLVGLNLSRNALHGKIPQKIGQLQELLCLDLSRNKLSGGIPASISSLPHLNCLDLSFNNLSGTIPTSTQLQSFNASQYTGNSGLCGPPLTSTCQTPLNPDPALGEEDDQDEFMRYFYIGAGTGFVAGFWGICGALLLNRYWRHAFFLLLDNAKDWIYVTMAVSIAKLI